MNKKDKILFSVFITAFLLLALFFACNAHADKLTLPFGCYPRELQAKFEEYDIKLDLDGADRTYDSWGYLHNEGNKFTLYSYRSATLDDMEIINEICHEHWGRNRDLIGGTRVKPSPWWKRLFRR